jgi:hypothetical protein
MKRVAVLTLPALLAVASLSIAPATTSAQGVSIQANNGWSFIFSGDVNAFLVYRLSNAGDSNKTINGGLTDVEGTNPRIRTGLLPAFATFDAKGHEGPFDLDVHFGFAPEIQNGGGALGNIHDNFGNGTQAGAQIDMRQVYLTFSGPSWGQIEAGRDMGLFDRQNILQDMTLFGVGAAGANMGNGGTTLGRIGYGYVYPNFVPQITYSTPAAKSLVWSIGIFDPSAVGGTGAGTSPFIYTRSPRVESELTWTGNLSNEAPAPGAPGNTVMAWIGGLYQNTADSASGGSTVTSDAGDAGFKLNIYNFSIVGSGYVGRGIGSTLLLTSALATDATGTPRTSWGGYGQVVYKFDPHWSLGGSFGGSLLDKTTADDSDAVNGPVLLRSNLDGTVMLTYQWTKALRWIGEYDWTQSQNQGGNGFAPQKLSANQLDSGFLLSF